MPTIPAASPSRADVLIAIGLASSGDTVTVPAGLATWSQSVSLGSKNLTLVGAGIGNTVITLTGVSGADGILMGTTTSDVSGFTFIISGSATDKCVYARGQNFRVHHNRFENQSSVASKHGFFADGSTSAGIPHPTGCVDHNEWYNTRSLVHGNADLFASVIWNQPTKIGNSDQTGVVYFENNTYFRNNSTSDVADLNFGGRGVFRYNSVTNGTVETHSVQQNGRAGKSWEIYNNIFISTDGRFTPIWIRGGTAVIYSNTITGNWTYPIVFDNVRSFTPLSYPPGTGNGTSNWDGNTGLYGYPLRDEPGRGSDASLWIIGTPPYPAQASEPVYVWSNTFNGATAVPTIHNNTSAVKPGGSSTDIQVVRDYILSARPAYTAYTYPNPLVSPSGGQTMPKRSAAAANAACNAMTALVNGGTVKIYTAGSGVPVSVADPITDQTLLATLNLSNPAFGNASAGVATANAIASDTSADATGTASFFRILSSGATAHFQGLCGTSGSDLNMPSLSIVQGNPVAISSLTVSEGLG